MANIMPFGSKERDQEGQLLVGIVASVLEELVSSSSSNSLASDGNKKTEVTKFHGLKPPGISIPEYLNRISRFSGCSDPCFVLSLIYIDRLITRKRIVLDHLNIHRLIITSVLLAAKFFDDHYLDNAHYAAVGGIPTRELNSLEVEFAFLAEFHLHVTSNDFDLYHSALSNKAHSQSIPKNPTIFTQTQAQQNQQQQINRDGNYLPYQQPQTQGLAPMAIKASATSHEQMISNGIAFQPNYQFQYQQQQPKVGGQIYQNHNQAFYNSSGPNHVISASPYAPKG